VPPRTAILFSYHKDDDVNIVDGRKPRAADEIAVDADFLTRNDKTVGDSIDLTVRNESRGYHIVGTLDLPGVDLTGIPLVAMSAAHQATELQVDRIDVNLKPGVNPANVRDRIAGALGADYTVVPPSTISFADQRLAQLEIQHAYWALLSSDANERSTSASARRTRTRKRTTRSTPTSRSTSSCESRTSRSSPGCGPRSPSGSTTPAVRRQSSRIRKPVRRHA